MSANWFWKEGGFETLCMAKSKIFCMLQSIAVIGKEAYVVKIFLLDKLDMSLTMEEE